MLDQAVSSFVIDFLSYLVLMLNVGTVFLLIVYLLNKFGLSKIGRSLTSRVIANSIAITLIIASVATVGSLFLSELAGFVPCKLCWYQRIFMYPIVLFVGAAFLNNENAKKILRYVAPVIVIGLLVAVYHFFIQMFPDIGQCSDALASCTFKQFARFGFVTIPYMSMSAFFALFVISFITLFPNKR